MGFPESKCIEINLCSTYNKYGQRDNYDEIDWEGVIQWHGFFFIYSLQYLVYVFRLFI